MSKFLAILMILALTLGSSVVAEEAPLTFGYIAWQMKDMRCAQSALAFEYAAHQNGIAVTRIDAEGDAQKALTALETLVDSQVDGIIIYVYTSQEAEPLIRAAKASGIPVVVENVDVSASVDEGDYLAAVGSGYAERSYAMAKYLAETHGNVTLFHCAAPEGSSIAQGCAEGLNRATNDFGSIDLVGTLNGETTVEEGKNLTDILINSFTEFDSILADSDAMAQGGFQAVNGSGYRGINIVTVGDSAGALGLLEDGTVSAVASSPSAIQGIVSFKVLHEYLTNGVLPETKFQALPAVAITAGDLESWESWEAYSYAYEYVYSGEPLESFDLEVLEARIAADGNSEEESIDP